MLSQQRNASRDPSAANPHCQIQAAGRVVAGASRVRHISGSEEAYIWKAGGGRGPRPGAKPRGGSIELSSLATSEIRATTAYPLASLSKAGGGSRNLPPQARGRGEWSYNCGMATPRGSGVESITFQGVTRRTSSSRRKPVSIVPLPLWFVRDPPTAGDPRPRTLRSRRHFGGFGGGLMDGIVVPAVRFGGGPAHPGWIGRGLELRLTAG